MVRVVVTPKEQDVSIHLPENYIGRRIEVLLCPVDEINEEKDAKRTMADFRGTLNLTDEEYKDLQQYVKDARNEWDKNI